MAFESQAYLSKQIDYGRFPATNLQIFFNTTKKNEKNINFFYILFNFPQYSLLIPPRIPSTFFNLQLYFWGAYFRKVSLFSLFILCIAHIIYLMP